MTLSAIAPTVSLIVIWIWTAIFPIAGSFLAASGRKVTELLVRAVIVYTLGWPFYELWRFTQHPVGPESWFLVGLRIYLTFLLAELSWARFQPIAPSASTQGKQPNQQAQGNQEKQGGNQDIQGNQIRGRGARRPSALLRTIHLITFFFAFLCLIWNLVYGF